MTHGDAKIHGYEINGSYSAQAHLGVPHSDPERRLPVKIVQEFDADRFP